MNSVSLRINLPQLSYSFSLLWLGTELEAKKNIFENFLYILVNQQKVLLNTYCALYKYILLSNIKYIALVQI